MNEYVRGTICYVDLGQENVGSEQGGNRPCIIISNNKGNACSPTVIVAVITSKDKKYIPTHVEIPKNHGGLISSSTVLLEQIRTIDKSRIISIIGVLPPDDMAEINKAILVSLDCGEKSIEYYRS